MVGHFVNAQRRDAEDRLLGGAFAPYPQNPVLAEHHCMVDRAIGQPGASFSGMPVWSMHSGFVVGVRYDLLCKRFGVERVNAAIRNRVLANQARRTLQGVRETAVSLPQRGVVARVQETPNES
jgi:hypothetical protein